MDDWINGICDQVDALVGQEPYYRELMVQRKILEQLCREILDSLPQAQRDHLQEYEYIIMELAYQRTQAAYRVGKTIGSISHSAEHVHT